MANMDAMRAGTHRSALQRMQKMDALGELLGGIDHEIKNLMQSIVASLELTRKMIESGRAGDTDKFVAMALVSAQRAAALNHRLAVFAVCRQPDPMSISVAALVEGMQDMLRAALGNAVKIEFEIASGLWQTFCDVGQTESALVNLIINARDAMPNGGAIVAAISNTSITQTAEVSLLPEGQYVSIAVTDTGAERHRDPGDCAFDSLGTVLTAAQGANSRLAWVRRFARDYGGDVMISSDVARGNTVTLYLPRHAVND